MKARVTFTDSDGDSGTVDRWGDWKKDGTVEADDMDDLLTIISSGHAAGYHEEAYSTTIKKIEIEIIG